MKRIDQLKCADNILKAIDIIVNNRIRNCDRDKTERGLIKTDNDDGTFVVTIHGTNFKLKARAGVIPTVNKVVYITVVNNDFSNKFIDCIVP